MLKRVKNEKGMAIMEIVPIMIIFTILINYALGFFGAIHSGILGSMAAKNYAYETFQHRADLTYLRDNDKSATDVQYSKLGFRWHASISDKLIKKSGANPGDQFFATLRPIDFLAKVDATGTKDIHNRQISSVADGKRFTSNDGVNPIWIRPQYGICLNAKCGN
jgi:hypothetical protein